jgi:hypothetical protein
MRRDWAVVVDGGRGGGDGRKLAEKDDCAATKLATERTLQADEAQERTKSVVEDVARVPGHAQ